MAKIVFTESYEKRAKNFFHKPPDLLSQYQRILRLLELNPKHPSLRLHPLQGRLLGLHSISINMKYRVTVEFIIAKDQVIPVSIGSHDEIYKN